MLAARARQAILLDFLVPSILRPTTVCRISTSAKCLEARPRRNGKRLAPQHLDTPEALELFQSVKASVSRMHNASGPIMTEQEVKTFNTLVDSLRTALSQGDMAKAARAWDGFDAKLVRENDVAGENKMGFTGLKKICDDKQFRSWSRAIHRLCIDVQANKVQLTLDKNARRVLGEISVAAATVSSSYDGLQAYLGLLLKHNKVDEIIKLTLRLFSFEEAQNHQEAEEEHIRESEFAFYDESVGSHGLTDTHYDPAKAVVLLFALSAYAAKQDFRAALEAALKTQARLSGPAIKRFTDHHLSQDPKLAERVDDYAYHIATARMVLHPRSFSRRITRHTEEGRLPIIERIYNDVVTAITGPDAYIAADPALNHDHKLVSMTENGWATFLAGFLKCRRSDLAEKQWKQMLEMGLQPGILLWTSLISGHGSAGNAKQALEVWEAMVASGIHPEALTYRALISGLFSSHMDALAMEKFAAFRQHLAASSPKPQVLQVFNTVLHGLLTSNNEDTAREILEDMKQHGPQPDLVSYNTFMRYHGRRGQFQAMADIVQELEGRGIVGDVFTFSTILSAFLKAGRPNAAEMIILFMRKHGVEPNVATQSAMIDQQIRQEDETGVRGAMDLLAAMERDPKTRPNEVTYTSILAGIHRNGHMSSSEKERIRKDIVHRMERAKIVPSRLTYQILIQACFDNPEPEGLQQAMHYYHTMVEQKIALTQETWYVVLRGLLQRGAWSEADDVVRRMFQATSGEPKPRVMDL